MDLFIFKTLNFLLFLSINFVMSEIWHSGHDEIKMRSHDFTKLNFELPCFGLKNMVSTHARRGLFYLLYAHF
jgi:hypothetical protein